jgi:plasmid stability protein
VWSGIHFRTADEDGARIGARVARFAQRHGPEHDRRRTDGEPSCAARRAGKDADPGSLQFSVNAAILAAMGVAITVRDVPDEVRDELAARAARAGKSLQEYIRGMLIDTAARPPVEDVVARARARVAATGVRVDAKSIVAARDADRR